jgi:hypothetical protein
LSIRVGDPRLLHPGAPLVNKHIEEEVAMDTESFTTALNEDLQTEYQSIIQHINYVATISGPGSSASLTS